MVIQPQEISYLMQIIPGRHRRKIAIGFTVHHTFIQKNVIAHFNQPLPPEQTIFAGLTLVILIFNLKVDVILSIDHIFMSDSALCVIPNLNKIDLMFVNQKINNRVSEPNR